MCRSARTHARLTPIHAWLLRSRSYHRRGGRLGAPELPWLASFRSGIAMYEGSSDRCQGPHHAAVRRSRALRHGLHARFSRFSTRVSCKAAHTTVLLAAWAHQNCHGSPHSDPGSPCTKGRAIDVRGHHAAIRRSRTLIQTSHSHRSTASWHGLSLPICYCSRVVHA